MTIGRKSTWEFFSVVPTDRAYTFIPKLFEHCNPTAYIIGVPLHVFMSIIKPAHVPFLLF